ncbi:hypothetical protein H8B09_06330 [Paenibacillus sp. PR3]|uniref:Uncharacterized protein n=1 Tax=Paenibacillus terricola TaxID=2763503 RepID=A0ABR8MTG8_9BACL|nr:hypothetical protein [Paenibacillus terricola]MBD3918366.1 hypothetical protein [Paenibacillus terricola]
MSWLQGGPFLELSFIFHEPTIIENVISKLNNIDVKIEVHNSPEYIQQFYEGYPFDEDDPHSKMIHRIEINLTVHTTRQRRALLFVEKISSELLSFSMSFFGAKEDASEWKQPGIRDEEIDEFICLLISLYRTLNFSVGGLAIEEDMIGLFDVNEAWPNEKYNFANLTFKNKLHKFYAILINQSLNEKLPEGQCILDNSCMLYRNALN